MSAITSHLEQTDPVDATPVVCEGAVGDPLGLARRCVPPLYSTHAGLERMIWLRRTLEDLMVGRTFQAVDGSQVGGNPERIYLRLDPPMHKWDVPWVISARDVQDRVSLISRPGKMDCPGFDLPAGWMLLGGTCPAAGMCQSVIPENDRMALGAAAASQGINLAPSSAPPGAPIDVARTVCQVCYAEGGNYASPHVAIGNILRLAYTRRGLESGSREDYVDWVETMARAIEGETFEPEIQIDARTGRQILPFRLHSSGDFFSPRYAAAWIDVANLLPEVTFWAPTRTWAAPGWLQHWPRLLGAVKHGNFVVRPSALHTGDAAPTFRDHPWQGEAYPFTSAGTTSLYQFEDATPASSDGRSADPRYDWGCQAYRAERAARNCRHALSPEGLVGCRACWNHPELRVNYVTH